MTVKKTMLTDTNLTFEVRGFALHILAVGRIDREAAVEIAGGEQPYARYTKALRDNGYLTGEVLSDDAAISVNGKINPETHAMDTLIHKEFKRIAAQSWIWITPSQWDDLLKTWGPNALHTTLSELENYNKLNKYRSFYQTLLGWVKRRNQPISRDTTPFKDASGDEVDPTKVVEFWNKTHGTTLKMTGSMLAQMRSVFAIYTKSEIKNAIQNRTKDIWLNKEAPDLLPYWDHFWAKEESVRRYMRKPKTGDKCDTIEQFTG